MSIEGCYANIIGLSRTDCPCLDDNIPSDASVSKSGLYLDESPWLNLASVQAATNSCQELWTILARAVENATRDLRTDLLASIRTNAVPKRQNTRGIIGEWDEATRLLNPDKDHIGMMIHTADMVGGSMTIERIGLKIDTTGNVDVKVYDRETLLQTYTVSAVAGSMTWYTLPMPLVLTMEGEGSQNPKYYFLWEPNGRKPYNTRIHCNCPGKFLPRYDCQHPSFESATNRNGYNWSQWVMATGIKGDDLNAREDWSKYNETQGLAIDASFTCDMNTVLCGDDYTDPLMMEQARAIQDKAAFYALAFIRSSQNVNALTLLNGEMLNENAARYDASYRARIEKLTELFGDNINAFSDCLTCKDPWGFKISTIHP